MLDKIFNSDSFPTAGGNCSVNMTQYSITNPFSPTMATTARTVFDLSDFSYTFSVIATGQSGQPFDPHYKDQLQIWRDGEYHRSGIAIEDMEQQNYDLLILKPK